MNNQHRSDIAFIFSAALKAVDPFSSVKNYLSCSENVLTLTNPLAQPVTLNLDTIKNVYVVGCGKAGAPMAAAVHELLGDRIAAGVVTVKYDHVGSWNTGAIRIDQAGHPQPDEPGMRSCASALELMDAAGEDDLVIALLSGGGSSLWPQPAGAVTLEHKMIVNRALLASGASIHEVNAVRKHFSAVKGGYAAQRCAPARVLVLTVSDVVGDNLDVIASGPFAPDNSTFAEVQGILKRYRIEGLLPERVRLRLEQGLAGEVQETPRAGDPCFARVDQVIVAGNSLALEAGAQVAQSLGYQTTVMESPLCGEAREASRTLVGNALKMKNQTGSQRRCLIAGGETTVTLGSNPGKGGRNQELALAAALEIKVLGAATLASLGTDGSDGPTNAAGGCVDESTVERAMSAGFDPERELERHNAYPVLDAARDLVISGPTGTNVMDIQVVSVIQTLRTDR